MLTHFLFNIVLNYINDMPEQLFINLSNGFNHPQFRDSPLDSFICYGCSRPYSGMSGLYSIDLKDNVMSMVCTHCKWWAERRIAARSCKYRAP